MTLPGVITWQPDTVATPCGDYAPPLPPEIRPLEIETFNLEKAERQLIDAALAFFGGNRSKAAHALGLNVRTLRRKLNGARR